MFNENKHGGAFVEKGFYLRIIGEGLILLAILSLFCYFTLWTDIGVTINNIVLIGIAFEAAGTVFLYLSNTITEEPLILAILLLACATAAVMISASAIITMTIVVICFSGAIYFNFRRDNKTVPPQLVTTE